MNYSPPTQALIARTRDFVRDVVIPVEHKRAGVPVVDQAAQIHWELGFAENLPIARIYRGSRPFRIYDGPSETRRPAVAKGAVRRARAPMAPTGAALSHD
jgi:hypothetical protein